MLREDKCCDQCWDRWDEVCTEQIDCQLTGPLCHEDLRCNEQISARNARLRREKLSRPVIYVGTGTCGLAAGAQGVLDALKDWMSEHQVDAEIVEVGCIGLCAAEPIMDIQLPQRTRVAFQQVVPADVGEILRTMLAGEVPTQSLLGQHRNEAFKPWTEVPYLDEHPFFAPQTRWVLKHCGIIDPQRLDEFIANGGFLAFSKVIRAMIPEEVCQMILTSGLRGRGGGGFPVGRKWLFALEAFAEQKYLICNADEGDPGAFMDRAVIEGDPFRVLEGMAIAAYAIGATKAYVYIRAEYPLAIARLRNAIEQAREFGLLGTNILDSGFDLDVIIKKGAGAFVCGEETALIHSVEGKRGMPRPRPPFPAVSGLFGKPTVINNVETLANISNIVQHGAEWFSQVGTEGSKGTKVFALSGKISRTGLVEVAMGTRIREIVFDIGGGIPDDKRFKAVQIGGPSGGCMPTEHLDIQVEYESLKSVGAMMGSGGLVVMDEDTCMVDLAKFFMDFIQRESCGKCIPCREGTRRLLEILNRITGCRGGENSTDALERFQGVMYLDRLAGVIKDTSLCGLGQTAPNPVLSTLRWFRDEYEAHIFDRTCPAGACAELRRYSIDEEACKGCRMCAKKCPSDAIIGALKSPHTIIEDKCISCGTCVEICKFDAISVA